MSEAPRVRVCISFARSRLMTLASETLHQKGATWSEINRKVEELRIRIDELTIKEVLSLSPTED